MAETGVGVRVGVPVGVKVGVIEGVSVEVGVKVGVAVAVGVGVGVRESTKARYLPTAQLAARNRMMTPNTAIPNRIPLSFH